MNIQGTAENPTASEHPAVIADDEVPDDHESVAAKPAAKSAAKPAARRPATTKRN